MTQDSAAPSTQVQPSPLVNEWRSAAPYGTVGSGRLERMLEAAIEVLGRVLPVPIDARPRRAWQLLHEINERPGSVAAADEDLLLRLSAAHRTAWEIFLIAYAMRLTRTRRYTPFTPDKLAYLFLGADVEGKSNTKPRNIQFELYVAAWLALGGAEVYHGEPDVRFNYGRERVGVAAKRILSPRPKQIKLRVRRGIEQIRETGMRGFLALNLDSRFQTVDPALPRPDLLQEFSNVFDQVNRIVPEWAKDLQVVGVMSFGNASKWEAPKAGETPALRIVAPVRWYSVGDHRFEFELFHAFVEGWGGRFKRRMEGVVAGEFED